MEEEEEDDEDGSVKTTVKIEILGCRGGSYWDDGAYSAVRRLVIDHKQWICSFHVEYIKNQVQIWGSKHGGNEPSASKSEVVLEYPNEYLISICGYHGPIHKWGIGMNVIRSLTLQSNRKTYGPFGMEEGTKFSFPIMGAKIVGFHGRSGWFLDAIGLYIHPIPKSQLKNLSLGPYGGKGGNPWEYVFSSIRRFVIHHELWIFAIQFQYEDNNGNLVWSKKHGDRAASSKSEVVLQFPDEYLVWIGGYYSDILAWGDHSIVIRSLTLKTNTTTYGPFGVEEGTKFSIPFMGANIVGFHGRCGWYLDAIGLYLGKPQKTKVETKPKSLVAPRLELKRSKLGPYGGQGGDGWENTFWTMRRFVVYHGLWIDSIQIEYEDDNENGVWSSKHGGNGGSRSEVVLEFPNEYLVSIHGYYSSVIRSLTLETNMKTYGPFGVEEGSKFSFPSDGVKVVGIHGRSGWYLDAIGVYVVSFKNN